MNETKNGNDFNLDFKLNLGMVIFGKFSDLQELKEYLDRHPGLRVIYQTLDKGNLWIKREE
jgi:hypothetical protein